MICHLVLVLFLPLLFFYYELPDTLISFGINKVDLDLCRKFRLPGPVPAAAATVASYQLQVKVILGCISIINISRTIYIFLNPDIKNIFVEINLSFANFIHSK